MNQAMTRPEVVETSIVEQLTRGEIDLQVRTAKQYPRNLKAFRTNAKTLAVYDPQTAASCFYVLPRGGKKIEGPSIRLAEIVANSWGNLRCQSFVLHTGETTITARAIVHDLETNVAMSADVSRRITDRNDRRYNDDMIIMTGNAAGSIALRNAIFKVVPFAHVKDIYDECQRVALGGKGLAQAREEWIKFFSKAGVDEEQILRVLGKESVDDFDIEDVTALQGIQTAISEGTTTVDDTFGTRRKDKPKAGLHSYGQKTNGKPKAKAKPEPKPADPITAQSKPVAEEEPPPHDPETGEVLRNQSRTDQLEF